MVKAGFPLRQGAEDDGAVADGFVAGRDQLAFETAARRKRYMIFLGLFCKNRN
jgi:hypothetical protein